MSGTTKPRYIVDDRVPGQLHTNAQTQRTRNFGPTVAFALTYPTIGYYTFATWFSLAGVEDSGPAIMLRIFSLLVLLIALLLSRRELTTIPAAAIPGAVFLLLYFLRLMENILYLNVNVEPGNGIVVPIYLIGVCISPLLIASTVKVISSRHARLVLSALAVTFVIGATMKISSLSMGGDISRLGFEKVNPISLAYVCSSFAIYYLLTATRNRTSAIEAVIMVPLLIFVAAQAKSRGMIISTAIALAFYVVITKGSNRVVALVVMVILLISTIYFVDPTYIDGAIESVLRIDTVTDESTAMRALSFRGAYEMFLDDPAFGRFVNEKYTGYYPHNIYLESLMAVGLIGSFPFFVHVLLAFRAAIYVVRNCSRDWVQVFVAIIFVREATGAAASGSIAQDTAFWTSSFLVISDVERRKEQSRKLE